MDDEKAVDVVSADEVSVPEVATVVEDPMVNPPVVDEPEVADPAPAVDPAPVPVPESLLQHVRDELSKVANELGLEAKHVRDAFVSIL